MSVSRVQVEYIAALAQLELTEVEKEEFTAQLNDILSFVDKLNELMLDEIPATSHPLNLQNSMRDDMVTKSLTVDEALANAPTSSANMFCVPQIFAGQEEA